MQNQELNHLFDNKLKSIIWDWNGTLLNDLWLCIESINILLKKRNLPVIDDRRYLEVFSFPVKDYYEKVGFDFSKEDFSIPAHEFIDLYNARVNTCKLHQLALPVLNNFKEKSIRQYVLSAMQQDMLEATLNQNTIFPYFDAVVGLDDHYAVSKIDRGKELLKNHSIEKDSACIIGDTIHDFEVATELGVSCILIADGHQSKLRLKKTGATVIDTLGDLIV